MQSVLEKSYSHPKVFDRRTLKKNGTPKPIRWTVDEYYRMYDLGLFSGKRVQLIRGEIIEMAPMGAPHSTALRLIVEALRNIFKKDYMVDSQLPPRFSQVDEPEPNIAVLRGRARDFVNEHPHTAVLIVEVADSSLRFDRGRKAELYAENKIEDYWIIDLKKRCVEIHRQPTQDTDLVYRYGEVFTVNEDSAISPLAMPKSKIKVGDILP